METDKKLDTMEEELKLLKGELKQSLASVRDFLLNMELPASEFADVLAALGDDDKQKVIMDGKLDNEAAKEEPKAAKAPVEEPPEEIPEEVIEPAAELPAEDTLRDEDGNLEPEDELEEAEPEVTDESDELDEFDEAEAQLTPESELPLEEEPPMVQEKTNTEASASTPKVNLLANLVHWIARAKREIGVEQLPAFLEVYGISGHLSPELKELILHMADVTMEQPEDGNNAETWSQAMLSLHGILTGAEAPLHAIKPFWNDESHKVKPDEEKPAETVAKKPKDTPVRLKLVLPGGNGQDKEFCLDLKPTLENSES
jgi:hypothetical protein